METESEHQDGREKVPRLPEMILVLCGYERGRQRRCLSARLAHGGRTTQVWEAIITDGESGKPLALFRCTRLVLYPVQQAADIRACFHPDQTYTA